MFLPIATYIKVAIIFCLITITTLAITYLELSTLRPTIRIRFEMWGIAWDKFKQYPWLGHGIGQWKTVLHEIYYLKRETYTWHSRAHNEFIQGAVEMGIPFILICIGYVVDILRRAKKQAVLSLTALIIIIVHSMISFPFHIPCTGIIAVSWLAILEIQLRRV